ncbi:MAG: SIMPL domain-containing protein [Candidatus Doudnabacteria bacterium]|nr:SIMPL domain-containing protein [Candidatus Doudnabacteria bacterium]
MNIKPWVLQALGVLLILFLAVSVIDKTYSMSQNFKSLPKNTISMSAEGKVSAKPDLATVSVGVSTNGTTAKLAQEENTKGSNKLIEFIKQQGVAENDIVTANFSVYPNYNYSNGRNTILSYTANQTLTVKVRGVDKSTANLGAILGGAADSGSNQIQGVYFSFDDPDNLRQEARKIAIEKAKQKAADLAAASGLRLGRIVTVSESSSYQPYPMPYALDAAKNQAGGATPPQIESGSQDITATMTLIFEIK